MNEVKQKKLQHEIDVMQGVLMEPSLVKTQIIEGVFLDCVVAEAEGWNIQIIPLVECGNPQVLRRDVKEDTLTLIHHWPHGWSLGEYGGWEDGIAWNRVRYRPSCDWSQGGPIIEREEMRLRPDCHDTNKWGAAKYWPDGRSEWWFGNTILVAAMRCYVASKFGDEIEIPKYVTCC
jgi:hypothetical protein